MMLVIFILSLFFVKDLRLFDISHGNVGFYTIYRAYFILLCLYIVVLHGKYQRTGLTRLGIPHYHLSYLPLVSPSQVKPLVLDIRKRETPPFSSAVFLPRSLLLAKETHECL